MPIRISSAICSSHDSNFVSAGSIHSQLKNGGVTVNIELKIALIRRFGSQIRAAKPLRIDESKLSRIVQGHRDPTPDERERLRTVLGVDCFADEPEGPRAA